MPSNRERIIARKFLSLQKEMKEQGIEFKDWSFYDNSVEIARTGKSPEWMMLGKRKRR